MLSLTVPERRAPQGPCPRFNPMVMIGNEGLTGAVLNEIDAALKAHELIKIRVISDDRDAREACWKASATELDAAPVQHIGKILVVYKPNPEAHQIELKKMPRHKGKKPLTKKQLGSR